MRKRSLLGLAITVSALILPGICAGALASLASPVNVDSSETLMLALKNEDVRTIILTGKRLCVTGLSAEQSAIKVPRA